jgi:hypothetical protein
MLSVIYAKCHLFWVSFMLSVIYAECRYAKYRDDMAYKELALEEKGKVSTF